MKSKFFFKGLLLFLLASLYIISHHLLMMHQYNIKKYNQQYSLFDFPPLALEIIAGEFKGLVADLIILEAGSQLGTEVIRGAQGRPYIVPKAYNWEKIYKLFMASQALDPAFAQTYILAEGWLPWKPANLVVETQQILNVASKSRPWDWRPIHDMGFNEYYFYNNPGKAGELYLEAAKIHNSPPFLAILGARLAQEGGKTRLAVSIMKSMIATKDNKEPGYEDMIQRLQALEGVLIIESAVREYKLVFGSKPLFLADLISGGILDDLPPNPYKINYCMDQLGDIYFDKPNCRNH